eukprot:SAG31_NODE_597_length_13674_cov_3.402947_3_plen_333_part_00
MPTVCHLYRAPGLPPPKIGSVKRALAAIGFEPTDLATEICYNVNAQDGTTSQSLYDDERVAWLFRETFEPEKFGTTSSLKPGPQSFVLELGPRLNFSTAWSSNCVSILKAAGVDHISRVEISRRFLFTCAQPPSEATVAAVAAALHDRMTEMVYTAPLQTFATGMVPTPTTTVPILAEGRAALVAINKDMGLGMDEDDIEYYTKLFQDMGRDPTTVEMFDFGQSNSEHSRHWFFKGRIVIDGQEQEGDLMHHVGATLHGPLANDNNGINISYYLILSHTISYYLILSHTISYYLMLPQSLHSTIIPAQSVAFTRRCAVPDLDLRHQITPCSF